MGVNRDFEGLQVALARLLHGLFILVFMFGSTQHQAHNSSALDQRNEISGFSTFFERIRESVPVVLFPTPQFNTNVRIHEPFSLKNSELNSE